MGYWPKRVLPPVDWGGGAETAEPTKDGDWFLYWDGEPMGDWVGGAGVSVGFCIAIIIIGSIIDSVEERPPPKRDSKGEDIGGFIL
jgi:hypothetical protein